jgi:hypothetical protein
MRGVLALVSLFVIVGVGASLPLSSSEAADPGVSVVQNTAGIDVSFPQCLKSSHVDFSGHLPFAVVGVNGGSAFNVNPCFASEYNSAALLAGVTDQPHASVYVNTGDPALAGVWWPSSNHTRTHTAVDNPNGSCDHLAGAACAYVYGYSMAQADYRRVHRTLVRMPQSWWLDVETSNTWQPDVIANAASISGMVDYFQSKGLVVGLYSTSYQWNKIAGATPVTSNLAGLPSWLAGGSYLGAPADCEKSPLTPDGRVSMVQYVTRFDDDYSCRQFPAVSARIAPPGQSVVGANLTARTGNWGGGDVSYSYQWNRDGSAIPGAISRSYVLTNLDAGATVTVTITGLKIGYSATSVTSNGIEVSARSAPPTVRAPD